MWCCIAAARVSLPLSIVFLSLVAGVGTDSWPPTASPAVGQGGRQFLSRDNSPTGFLVCIVSHDRPHACTGRARACRFSVCSHSVQAHAPPTPCAKPPDAWNRLLSSFLPPLRPYSVRFRCFRDIVAGPGPLEGPPVGTDSRENRSKVIWRISCGCVGCHQTLTAAYGES